MTDAPAAPAPRRHDPLVRPLETFTALGVVAVLALLLVVAAFTRPTQGSERRGLDYEQTASLTYNADTAADSIYGTNGLDTGETVVLDQVDELEVRLDYALTTTADASVTGTARLEAVVTVEGGLRRTFRVADGIVTSTTTTLDGELPLDQIERYVNRAVASLGSGTTGMADVVLQPTVDLEGTLDGRPLTTSFAPAIPFTLGGDSLAVASDGAAEPDAGNSDDDPDVAVLNPSESGEVTYTAATPATLSLLVVDPRVTTLRWVAALVLLVCLVGMVVIGRRLFARGDDVDEVERIVALHGPRLVAVDRLDLREGPVAEVSAIDDLVELAKRYETAIMHVRTGGSDVFWLWDVGLAYRYTPRTSPASSTAAPETQAPTRSREGSAERVDRRRTAQPRH